MTIPVDALAGNTRMRVRLHDSSIGGNTTPCGTSTYGQVEDYTLNIGVLATGENALANLQVYPNPATDVLNITKVSGNATYTIYNIAGQMVSKGKIADNKVPVSKLQSGVYMISIEDKGNVEKVKFIKK
ncbi:MAG TPA: T9SS type A sorting domain-containing protein [Kaistella sp.]|nr:T9SS type A sorting domain-containing protein [Kaistella sp.]